MESYRCPVCGNPIAAYTAYCVHCGTRLSWQAPTVPAQTLPPQHHGGGGGAIIAVGLIAILAIAAIAGGYIAAPSLNSLANQVRSIYNYVRCGASTCAVTVPTTHKADYDQQIAFIYGPNYSYLSTNVVMVFQNDTDGFGPSYLLNGLSSAGWWYQVGVSYNWPLATGQSYSAGVHFAWEVFSPSGNTTAPLLENFSPARAGDNIHLSMRFSGGNVIMAAYDNNTGASASHAYSAFGSTVFYGRNTVNDSRFFTGLMTEWYHGDAYYVTQNKVAYTGQNVPNAWVCIDAFAVLNHQLVYGQCSVGSFTLSGVPQTYSYQGLNTSMTTAEFDTGPS